MSVHTIHLVLCIGLIHPTLMLHLQLQCVNGSSLTALYVAWFPGPRRRPGTKSVITLGSPEFMSSMCPPAPPKKKPERSTLANAFKAGKTFCLLWNVVLGFYFLNIVGDVLFFEAETVLPRATEGSWLPLFGSHGTMAVGWMAIWNLETQWIYCQTAYTLIWEWKQN